VPGELPAEIAVQVVQQPTLGVEHGSRVSGLPVAGS
jgi:hypothetical protein